MYEVAKLGFIGHHHQRQIPNHPQNLILHPIRWRKVKYYKNAKLQQLAYV